jgi:hypothetical protein
VLLVQTYSSNLVLSLEHRIHSLAVVVAAAAAARTAAVARTAGLHRNWPGHHRMRRVVDHIDQRNFEILPLELQNSVGSAQRVWTVVAVGTVSQPTTVPVRTPFVQDTEGTHNLLEVVAAALDKSDSFQRRMPASC